MKEKQSIPLKQSFSKYRQFDDDAWLMWCKCFLISFLCGFMSFDCNFFCMHVINVMQMLIFHHVAYLSESNQIWSNVALNHFDDVTDQQQNDDRPKCKSAVHQ